MVEMVQNMPISVSPWISIFELAGSYGGLDMDQKERVMVSIPAADPKQEKWEVFGRKVSLVVWGAVVTNITKINFMQKRKAWQHTIYILPVHLPPLKGETRS